MSTPVERFPLGADVHLADLDVDPYPILARLREREPVSWVPEIDMWFVTRREDVVAVLRDAATFTTEAERSTIRDIFGDHMMTTDGDRALRYKRACLHAFRADTLARDMTPWVEERAEELVRRAAGGGSFDFGDAIARPLAVETALRVLGLPVDLGAVITGWYDDFAVALANFQGDERIRARGKAAAAAFGEQVRSFLATASTEERGLLTHLAGQADDPWTESEIVSNALIILFGGIETTESMLSTTVWCLLETEWWVRLLADRDLGPALIEESMRWQPAVQSITRHTTRSSELRGVEIPSGSIVQCMIGGANRDPDHFAEPDTFDPERANARDHLSLGVGRHLCLGAHLARIEISAVLGALVAAVPELRFAGGDTPPIRGYEFRRPVRMTLSG